MNHTKFFGKRPNWILQHPTMYGNAYAQAVYTHLRGMDPSLIWRSERDLAKSVSDQTGFSLSVSRKSLAAIKKAHFYTFSVDGKLLFPGPDSVLREQQSGYVGSQSGYTGSQSGYVGSHSDPSEQVECATREVEKVEVLVPVVTAIGDRTNVLSPITGADAHKVNEQAALILGVDPDEEVKENKTPKKRPETDEVLDHFNFIARKMGAAPVTGTQDIVMFKAHTKRALKSGLTVKSLVSMIDSYFQLDRNRQHRYPGRIFYAKEVQQKLSRNVRHVEINDEVLLWMSNDFTRTQELPWPEECDRPLQNLVFRQGMSLAYRYPDLLSQIIKKSEGDLETAETLISSAATLINLYLQAEEDSVPETLAVLRGAGIELPKDLSRKRIRKEAMTLQEAIVTAHRLNH